MRLGSARDLKRELLDELVTPLGAAASRLGTTGVRSLARAAAARGLDPEELVFGMGARPIGSLSPVQRSLALGVAPDGKGSYRSRSGSSAARCATARSWRGSRSAREARSTCASSGASTSAAGPARRAARAWRRGTSATLARC